MIVPIYTGFDPREEVGTWTFCSSVVHHATMPVSFTILDQALLGHVWKAGHRDGSNAFTYLRFLVPYLQMFTGWALFADGADMVCRADIAELWEMRNPHMALQVVQHSYKTKHSSKYLGTQMETTNRDYPRKNWSSLQLINCSHFAWRQMTPEMVGRMRGEDLHRFSFIPEERIGELPAVWNWLADEFGENDEAKICHWSNGIPAWPQYSEAPMAVEWERARLNVTHATP